MNARIRLLSVIPVAALVLGIVILDRTLVNRQGALLKTNLKARHETAKSDDLDFSETLPVLDFPLLGQARPLDLINMELEFPDALKKLDGRRVSLVGFMAPYDSLTDMRRCMIVPSYVGCTFCSPPNLSQVVYVTQGSDDTPARPYPFIEEASHVSGTLRLSLPGSDHEGQGQGFHYSLENAAVTAHTGDALQRAPGHKNPADHKQGQGTAPLPPIAMADLVREVAELLGQEPLHPVTIEAVSAETMGKLVRDDLETTFPESTRTARAQAFSLLGMLPEDADWIDTLVGIQLAWRVAATDGKGERIHLLNSVSDDHPYIRLLLVGEIAEALTRQRFHRKRRELGGDRRFPKNDDARRAHEALLQGLGGVAMYRYARSRGISTSVQPPVEFIRRKSEERTSVPGQLHRWQSLPREVGPFFVDFLVGPTGPLSGIDPALARPPSTTMELFRPRWHQDDALWQRDPVPSDFADDLIEIPPILTDVLGIGGLVPWLAQWYSVYVARSYCGQWAGDRWAVWQFPDGTSALLLETRWQDDDAALQFRNAISDTEFLFHETGSRTVRVLRAKAPNVLDRLTSALAKAQ